LIIPLSKIVVNLVALSFSPCYTITMPFEYILLDNKRYAIMADGYKPFVQRQRSYDVGLTGKAIIQDFTVEGRVPQMWAYRLKVYIDTVEPFRVGYGNSEDFVAAYRKPYLLLTDHFGISHAVGFPKGYSLQPRVPADLGVYGVYGIFYVDVELIELYGTGLTIPEQVIVPPIIVTPINPSTNCVVTDDSGTPITDNFGVVITLDCPPLVVITDRYNVPITDDNNVNITT